MGKRQSKPMAEPKAEPSAAGDEVVDRDSAGVYLMSVEDFERRIAPAADAEQRDEDEV